MSHSVKSSIALLTFVLAVPLHGQDAGNRGNQSPTVAQPGNSVAVPVNTMIPLQLRSTINSRTAFVGQPVYGETIYPITIDDHIVIPAGSYIKGEITEVARPGRIKGRAQVGLRFNSLTLRSGVTRPLSATLAGFGGAGGEGFDKKEGRVQGVSSKGEDAGRVLSTTTEGTIIGGLAGRSAASGAAGAASGGLGGLIWVLATRGKDVILTPGTDMSLQLTRPLILPKSDLVATPPPPEDLPPVMRRD